MSLHYINLAIISMAAIWYGSPIVITQYTGEEEKWSFDI